MGKETEDEDCIKYIGGRMEWFIEFLKCAYQRVTKGYCCRDIYCLNRYYLEIFKGTLAFIRDHAHGYPDSMDNPEEWAALLAKIAMHCDKVLRFYDEDQNGFDRKTEYDAWLERQNELEQEMLSHRKKALQMISDHFEELWD